MVNTLLVDKNASLKEIGINNTGEIYWNLPTAALYEEAIRRHEGTLAHLGPFVISTGEYTGRLPQDKFFVKEPSSEIKIAWGKVNRPFEADRFDALKQKVLTYLQGEDIFIEDSYAGADSHYQIPIRTITTNASHALFARNMFIRELDPKKLADHKPVFTVIHAPDFHAVPEVDGTHSDAFIILNFAQRLILIGGTAYAGEIKKSIFTVMNYLLPQKGVLALHSSANYGKDLNDVVVFFGLSGTGKTTLSATPERTLIGDDEHGWSNDGIFNFEGGCYAKVIRLSKKDEPEIYETTRKFGTLIENVVVDPQTHHMDLEDDTLTENTRAAYPISHIPNMTLTGKGGHPKNIIMLTCDAFGVLPPISRLTPAQAMYHFLSGYTAKVAGTEAGVKEPQATFSTCFGAPFMPLPATTYAKLLGEKIAKHKVDVWLVNTGWSGGPYGEGRRMDLSLTRALVSAVQMGKLKDVKTEIDPIFGVAVPLTCPGVESEILNPRHTWKNADAYDKKARELAKMFIENFKEYENDILADVKTAGPKG